MASNHYSQIFIWKKIFICCPLYSIQTSFFLPKHVNERGLSMRHKSVPTWTNIFQAHQNEILPVSNERGHRTARQIRPLPQSVLQRTYTKSWPLHHRKEKISNFFHSLIWKPDCLGSPSQELRCPMQNTTVSSFAPMLVS